MASRSLRLALLGAVVALGSVRAAPGPVVAPQVAPPRIVAVGDVHGAAEEFPLILQRAGLIDPQRKWIGGTAILVQTGDVMDRGTGTRAMLDLLMALEPQARAAGGRVHALMGNHEAMNLLGDTRDATAEIYATFADAGSQSRRERAFAIAQKINKKDTLDKAAWLADHPPGYIEYREALEPNGRYGKWLRSKPVVTEIAGTIFMHGGLKPEVAAATLDEVNRQARRELSAWDDGVQAMERQGLVAPFALLTEILAAAQAELERMAPRIKTGEATETDVALARLLLPLINAGTMSLIDPDGPLWFRGYATWPDAVGAPQMAALLKKYKAKRFVTGHTPQIKGIVPRFGNTLFLIDTGMLGGRFYPGGRPSALEIVGDTVTAIYADSRQPM